VGLRAQGGGRPTTCSEGPLGASENNHRASCFCQSTAALCWSLHLAWESQAGNQLSFLYIQGSHLKRWQVTGANSSSFFLQWANTNPRHSSTVMHGQWVSSGPFLLGDQFQKPGYDFYWHNLPCLSFRKSLSSHMSSATQTKHCLTLAEKEKGLRAPFLFSLKLKCHCKYIERHRTDADS
jgi:hypothetical protein